MIEEYNQSHINGESNHLQHTLQQEINVNSNNINYQSTQLKNTSKKQTYELKFMKQLKSKDIKLSYKKINGLSLKGNSNKLELSFENEKQLDQSQLSPQNNHHQGKQLKKSQKLRKSQQSQKIKQKQKSEIINGLNPQIKQLTKQTLTLIPEKYSKKIKSSEINLLKQRIRQSRSQNKKQKVINTNNYGLLLKNNSKITYQNQNNIFQSIDLFAKQNSHHSLDKNQPLVYPFDKIIAPFSSKIQEKLHLPSLVNGNGFKNSNRKPQNNTSLPQEQNQTQLQKAHSNQEKPPKTDKSTPYIQKLVKIPIDRLKPLKPEQIKLKFQQKVKQEQKNRAKQRALQIFAQQEQQVQKKKYQKKIFETESEQAQQLEQEKDRNIDFSECTQAKNNKSSLIKPQKFISNKGDNIFKKKLILFNGQS